LLQLPRAELVVLDVPEGQSRQVLLDRLAARHVDSSRVRIHYREDILAYFNAIGNVDIALDTFPYNGATTTLDTLWMGTPLVALRGDRGTARSSYSIMSSLQLPELIARTAEEYVTLNMRLAEDAIWRKTLRTSMRNRLLASPLMNAGQFVADLEAGYRHMWQKWCTS
jgi:predicted O-linked N-acetylglucosamine transferase (SPINDLY family)